MTISSTSSQFGSLFNSATTGIQRAETQANTAANDIAHGNIDAQSMVSLDEAEIEVKANAASIRTGDEMWGALLNVKA